MADASQQRIEIIGLDGDLAVFEGDHYEFVTGPLGMKMVRDRNQTGRLAISWSEPLARKGARVVVTVTNPTAHSTKAMVAAGLL